MKQKVVLVLFMSLMTLSLCAKPKLVKLSDYVYYEGEVDKKIPLGKGTMIAFNLMGKPSPGNIYNADRQSLYKYMKDEISGEFHNDTVRNSIIVFASKWKYFGDVVYEITENGIIYHLQKDGILQPIQGDRTGNIIGDVTLAGQAKIQINLATNEVQFDMIPFFAKHGLNKTYYSHLFGFPMDFILRYNFLFTASIAKQDFMNTWRWEGIKGIKLKSLLSTKIR